MIDKNSGSITTPAEIDKVVHEPSRMIIMALLFVLESADFMFIMRQTKMTFGNLSSHISTLESAGYIEVEKSFRDKKPNTAVKLTSAGREAFTKYQQIMKTILG